MEWDENLPWYRPVRVCHCPPGAEFVWRTGSANTPAYYIDSLPAIYDVGRGSPVGMEFYEHTAFPQKYRGAYLMADWSLGIIYAAHLHADGATYKLDLEKFCTGAPMNVTDIGVAPDGSVYFTMGGRHTQGGVYRIVYAGERQKERSRRPRKAFVLAAAAGRLEPGGAGEVGEGEENRPGEGAGPRRRRRGAAGRRPHQGADAAANARPAAGRQKSGCSWSRTRTPRSAPRPST